MTDLVIGEDEFELLEERPELAWKEHDGFAAVDVSYAEDGVSIIPWLVLESGVLPEAFQMSLASIVPYFFETILREADVDFAYTEMDGTPWEDDVEYSSAVKFYLRRKDLEGLFKQIRKTGALGLYDVFFQLPEEDVVYHHDEKLAFAGFEDEELEEIMSTWEEKLDERF
ncbi:MAG: hypothetical protein SV186_00815 [Candidatus Nanohaloarchaea archaeon]|nr:hypothetical protein [Candidatus Nanohaloarchaea archaeon]